MGDDFRNRRRSRLWWAGVGRGARVGPSGEPSASAPWQPALALGPGGALDVTEHGMAQDGRLASGPIPVEGSCVADGPGCRSAKVPRTPAQTTASKMTPARSGLDSRSLLGVGPALTAAAATRFSSHKAHTRASGQVSPVHTSKACPRRDRPIHGLADGAATGIAGVSMVNDRTRVAIVRVPDRCRPGSRYSGLGDQRLHSSVGPCARSGR